MQTTDVDIGLTTDQIAELAHELRRELARVARTLVPGETSDAYHDLTEAIARLEDGTYGVCAVCAGHIAYGRLAVMPAARTCVGCR